jgi:hypothetical protein
MRTNNTQKHAKMRQISTLKAWIFMFLQDRSASFAQEIYGQTPTFLSRVAFVQNMSRYTTTQLAFSWAFNHSGFLNCAFFWSAVRNKRHAAEPATQTI